MMEIFFGKEEGCRDSVSPLLDVLSVGCGSLRSHCGAPMSHSVHKSDWQHSEGSVRDAPRGPFPLTLDSG